MTSDRLRNVQTRIENACRICSREPSEIRLLAVSKQQSSEAVARLHEAGLHEFGENRLPEALEKQRLLRQTTLCWHFIGPIQSNKTREIANHFHWVQSADREKIIRRLNDQRSEQLPALNVCLQVNIDEEPQKSGALTAEIPALAALTVKLPRLKLRGLMCIPRFSNDPGQTRKSFQRLAQLAESLRESGFDIDTLSMGMSADLELAIECGSTMIRVGTDLFGPRHSGAQ